MKHILLATTTLAMSAGVAAADISTSATAKLSYGNFGDDHCRAGELTLHVTQALSQPQLHLTQDGEEKLTLTS